MKLGELRKKFERYLDDYDIVFATLDKEKKSVNGIYEYEDTIHLLADKGLIIRLKKVE